MIYLVTNKLDGKRYIGKTSKTLEFRWQQHCRLAKQDSKTYLHRAIKKHGRDNFIVEKLCEGLDNEEIIMIKELEPEYNMTLGGDGGDTSNSPNYKMSIIMRKSFKGSNNPMYGRRGINNPKFGKKYGKKPNISKSKMKKLVTSDNQTFFGYQSMLDFYNVKSQFSLKKLGITWSIVE